MSKLNGINFALTLSSFIGLGLSIYSYFIEQQDESYKAYCDISDVISCSKTFKSKYGTGFGIIEDIFGENFFLNKPNSLLGIVTYSVLIVLSQLNNKPSTTFHFICSILSVILSAFLAYMMVFKVKTICVICLSTYVVNISNFLLSRTKLKILSKEKVKRI
ncbi:vitamin K epoxide reductase complex subunit 1-like protein 1 [Onthophagus taurus]|uniref:vitamin K epoxide reductase complex subunit 1-like protein 1 n=1 Tax=Onthophagus taurus TaxID=166361 RepID=UPI000C20E510|nr:vitamin K epoxide reductase complex subunit 1 [Onthophagus taurus]